LSEEAPRLRSERKSVTVVFIDLVGFTANAEAMDPEDVGEVLAPYHARVKTELQRYGGTVEKFIGDAVMAIFGAPRAHDDDPERAVRAALACREWTLSEGDRFRVRIGVNGGEALVTIGARPERGEGMAVGDVINTAARLQAAAGENEILVGKDTYRGTSHAIDYGPPRSVTAKGKSHPFTAWPALSAFSTTSTPVPPKTSQFLVGRSHEVELLSTTLARVSAERSPQLVTIVGVPGIGKTRLVAELHLRAEDFKERAMWCHGRSPAYGTDVSYWALSEIVKSQAGILATDDVDGAARKLSALLGTLIADPIERAWMEPYLAPLVGILDANASTSLGDAAFTAWVRFFEALAERGPVVVVFEDLHWADESLLAFVEYLVEWATQVALLVVATARPELLERRPGWGGGKPNVTTISLTRLSDAETTLLVDTLLENAEEPRHDREAVIGLAAGNPLFAEQFVRMLDESGADSGLPHSVHGVIAARIDALTPDGKSLLQNAAVIGKVFWSGAVAAIAEVDAASMADELHALERKELVHRVRQPSVGGQAEFAFQHALVRDVAYSQIPRAMRARKHVAAAEWLARLAADRVQDRSEMMAHHYQNALALARASGYPIESFAASARDALASAGARAWALGSYTASAHHFDDALTLTAADDPRHAELRFASARSRYWAGESAFDQMVDAFDALRAQGDAATTAEAAAVMSRAAFLRGERDAADAYADLAVELTASLPDSPARVAALTARAMRQADGKAAIRMGLEALPLARVMGLRQMEARLLSTIGGARVRDGDRRGLSQMEEAVVVAQGANSAEELQIVYDNLHGSQELLGLRADAMATHAVFGELVERYGSREHLRWYQVESATHAVDAGSWDEALALIEPCLRDLQTGSPHALAPAAYSLRSFIRLGRGQLVEAEQDARTAIELLPAKITGLLQQFPMTALAMVMHEDDRDVEADSIVTRLLASPAVQGDLPAVGAVLACLAADLGHGDELNAILAHSVLRTPWIEATQSIAVGEPAKGADILAGLGVLALEAYVRLHAARRMVREGALHNAALQARRALDVSRRIDATGWARSAEETLAVAALPPRS